MNRRHFLRYGLNSAVSMTAASTLPISVLSSAKVRATQDYRAVVCVLLAGGADSFNILVPRSETAYGRYQSRRSDLALSQQTLLPLNGEYEGVSFGLHPAMSSLQQRFNAGQATVVTNIGPLVEPTSRAALEAESVRLPLGLFSHSDQILSWQTATPANRAGTGFGGRLIDALPGMNSGLSLAGNISLSGNNSFQSGAATGSYAINANSGVKTIGGFDNDLFKRSFERLMTDPSASTLQTVYGSKIQSAIDAGEFFNSALGQALPLVTPFAGDSFSLAMKRIAELASLHEQLGVTRQTFFVTYGGWDHHEDTLGQQADMLPALDAGLGQFQAAMEELGLSNQVTTFTISDFGRTLTSNGKGSDHGWGGNAMVLGGAVQGGQLYGHFPEQVEDNPLDVGRGRYLPSTAVDAMYAEVSRWMGVSPDAMNTVLPNWRNFEGSAQGTGLTGMLAG
ncbi:MAG: DUF1501 domain-containing protein [Halieaceae bacterium]|nr:DUF1501 domain-containing protein [Halieaceae bacterium]